MIRDSWLDGGIAVAQPWTDFAPNVWTDGRLAEHRNTGPAATINDKRPQLSASEALAQTPAAYLGGTDGWDPTGAPAEDAAPLAP
ncbi:hypothetical protein DZF97_16490, partial [Clavibacter nebraskensis]